MFDKLPKAVEVIILDETSSTMREAEARRSELQKPTWILAKRQTAGQGRRGRVWAHPAGNFAATLTFRPECTPSEAGLRSFIAACALREALSVVAPQVQLSLKWPNDVLLAGGKAAGILLESTMEGSQTGWLSIGIGVNLAEAPPNEGQAFAPVSVRELTGQEVTPEAFLVHLATAYHWREELFRAEGFAPIRDEWLRHAAHLGAPITARLPRESYTGIFAGLDFDGNLLLETAQGLRTIAAAEVFFGV